MADQVDPYAAAADSLAQSPDVQTAEPALPPEPTAPVDSDPFQAAADQLAGEHEQAQVKKAQLLEYRADNATANPEARAQALKYSDATGVPLDVVERNLPEMKQRVEWKADWRGVADNQPGLVELLDQRPEVTPLVKDDVHNLGAIERFLGKDWVDWYFGQAEGDTAVQRFFGRSPIAQLSRGVDQAPAVVQALVDAVKHEATVYKQFQIASTSKGVTVDDSVPADARPPTDADSIQGAVNSADRTRRQSEVDAAAAVPEKDYGAGESLVRSNLLTAAKMVPFVGGNMAAGAAAGPAGVIGFNYYETVGPVHQTLQAVRDSDGNPLDDGLISIASNVAALGVGVLFSELGGKFLGSTKVGQKVTSYLAGDVMTKVLASKGVPAMLTAGLKQFGTSWANGVLLMAVQAGITTGSQEAAQALSGQPGLTGSWSKVGTAMATSAADFLRNGALISAAGPVRETLEGLGRAKESAAASTRLKATAAAAADSKLLEHSEGVFEQAVGKMAQQADTAPNVYVPVEKWVDYWQGQKVDPGEVAKAITGDDKAYHEATSTGGDIALPVEKYLAKLGKTEHVAGLEKDAKLASADWTPRQQLEEGKRQAKKLEQLAKANDVAGGKAAVHDFINELAVAAGVEKDTAAASAKLVSEYAATMATRLGVTVQEAADMGALSQLHVLGPKGESISMKAREAFQAFVRPDASKVLEGRLATMSPEARAREYALDEHVSGLRNRLAFDAAPAPDGKDQVAVITTPDIKGINDHPTAGGHDVGNELLRAIGKSVGDGREDAARSGTNFLLHVKDQAELDQVLAKVKAELGNDRLHVIGALGENTDTAFKTLDTNTETLRTEKKLPARGGLHPELAVDKLAFKPERAAGTVPEALVQEVSKLSNTEYARRVYLDKVDGKETGLLTRAGWDALPRKAHVASIDARGLKAVNAKYGKEVGNKLLFALADTMADFGGAGVDATHLSGDEFAAQHDDPLVLQQFVDRLRERLQDRPAFAENLSTGKRVPISVDFRHGIGTDYAAADRALNVGKLAEGEVGAGDNGRQDGRGDLGSNGQPGRDAAQAEGAQRQGDQGPELRRRGTRRQGFGEVVSHIEGTQVSLNEEGQNGGPQRGRISFQLEPDGTPRSFRIQLLNADRSTFLHETAHFLSWSMHDLAESHLATSELKDDYLKLVKWAGFGSVKERLFASKEYGELATKQNRTPAEDARLKSLAAGEEKISHGFEQYLLEGKSPSSALARVFSKFRGWLTNIYKGVTGVAAQYQQTYGAPLELSDDVRGIFNRLLAQDQAIAKARADTGAAVSPADPTKAMTPAQREHFTKLTAAADAKAKEELAGSVQKMPSVVEARARITREVSDALDEQPVYAAQRYLQRGEVVGYDAEGKPLPTPATLFDNGKPYKLDKQRFVAQFGPDEARLMPSGVFAKKGEGHPIDQVAPLLGYDDGAAMVDAFKKVEPRDRAIARQTQERVDTELAGDVGFGLAEKAMAAEHNELSVTLQLATMRGLAKQADPATVNRVHSIDPAVKERQAKTLIDGKRVGDLEPALYARTERALAIEAAKLWKSDKAKSLDFQETRYFNALLFREARDAKESLDRIEAALKPSEDQRATLGKADPSYRDSHDALLHAVGLTDEPGNAGSLDGMIAKATADGHELDVDMDSVRELLAKPVEWDQLTVEQARNVADTITTLRHIARRTVEVDVAGKQQSKAAYVQAQAERLAKVQPPLPRRPADRTMAGFVDEMKSKRRSAQVLLEDNETWAEQLDGGTSGPAHDLLIRDYLAAREVDIRLTKQVLEPIKKAWAEVPKEVRKLRRQAVDVADLLPVADGSLSAVYSRSALWMLWLNWGNEGNRQRIRDGNGWSDENVQKALNLLKPSEVKFLQTVLDSIQSLYPELAAAHEKRTGLKLGKVDAVPITVNGETSAGGYFPLKYDSRRSNIGNRQEITELKDLQAPAILRPTLPGGHTKGRVDAVKHAAVDLSWGVVQAHLSNVIRDISYGDWARQTGSIFLDKGYRDAVTNHLGPERFREFMPWLSDTALNRVDSSAGHANDFLSTLGRFARGTLARNVMGLNIPAFGRHLTDPYSLMADSESIPVHRIFKAYCSVWNPANWNRPEYALSKELAYHDAKHADNLKRDLGRIGSTELDNALDAYTDMLFALQRHVDHFTTRVGFTAAYEDAMARGATQDEAVARADDVLRRHFSSGDIASKPPILRTKSGLGAVVIFYGYASKMHNLRARSFDQALRTWNSPEATGLDRTKAIATVAGKWLALAAVSSLGAYLAGRGPKKDEDKKRWLAEEVALSPLDDIPVVGPLAKAAATGHKANVASTPEAALFEDGAKKLTDLIHQPASKKRDASVWGSVSGLLQGVGPGGAIRRTGGYLGQLKSGEARPRGGLDVGAGLLYGNGKNASVNPLTDAETLLTGKRQR